MRSIEPGIWRFRVSRYAQSRNDSSSIVATHCHEPLAQNEGTRSVARVQSPAAAKIFFIYFVDAIFTTLFERLFTKSFDRVPENTAGSCLYPPRISD